LEPTDQAATRSTSVSRRDVQALFFRRRHQPRRPPLAKIRRQSAAHKEHKPSSKKMMGFIVSKRLGSRYRSGRSRHWIKSKNPKHPAVKREAEEDWGQEKWR